MAVHVIVAAVAPTSDGATIVTNGVTRGGAMETVARRAIEGMAGGDDGLLTTLG